MIYCPTCQKPMQSSRGMGGHVRACGKPEPKALFWSKVEKSSGCWLYKARLDALGYGRFDRKGPLVFAHRCAWIYTHGPIPDGLDVCHTCDVRNCCNPAHLFLGTHDDNMADCKAKGRNVRGARSRHAKLTEAQVIEIRMRYQRTVSCGHTVESNALELAAEYRVQRQTITHAALGHTWKHLETPGQSGGDERSPK